MMYYDIFIWVYYVCNKNQKIDQTINISSVVRRLSSESLLLRPRQLSFFTDLLNTVPSSNKHATC
jgi:hypothetical protein